MDIFPNTICVDCYSDKIKYASINNAVFLCFECAKEHLKLGENISFLIKLVKNIDQGLLLFIQRGGNDRFDKVMKEYRLSNMPISYKYRTKAANYYRQLIYTEVNCEEPPEAVAPGEGYMLCQDNEVFKIDFKEMVYRKGKKDVQLDSYQNIGELKADNQQQDTNDDDDDDDDGKEEDILSRLVFPSCLNEPSMIPHLHLMTLSKH